MKKEKKTTITSTKPKPKPKIVIPKVRVLIIGETCKDSFIYCSSERLSPEAPVPVLKTIRKVENWGMAANVYENLKALVNHKNVVIDTIHPRGIMPLKTRYVDEKSNHYFFRVDQYDKVQPILFHQLIEASIKKADYIVISDYDKGFLTEKDICHIRKLNHMAIIFLDTKKKITNNILKHVDYIKINLEEFKYNFPNYAGNPYILYKTKGTKKFIVTMGGEGAYYNGIFYEAKNCETLDVSGAGDTFLAALVAEFININKIEKSIPFANAMAGEVVKHRGVSVIENQQVS